MIVSEHYIPPGYSYSNRTEKAALIAKYFDFALQGPLLDVGCGSKYLQQCLPEGFDYTGLDVVPEADIHLDLDRVDIAFKDESFSTVVCTDVLEHLENFHSVFNRLIDLSSRYVLLSLPNCWNHALHLVISGRSSGDKYGLPLENPQDRHRWYFGCSEAKYFLTKTLNGKGRKLDFYHYFGLSGRGLAQKTARLLFPRSRYENLFVHTLWAVLEK